LLCRKIKRRKKASVSLAAKRAVTAPLPEKKGDSVRQREQGGDYQTRTPPSWEEGRKGLDKKKGTFLSLKKRVHHLQ